MVLRRSGPGYTVSVDSLLLGDTKFIIWAAVEYDTELSEEERVRLIPMARIGLLLAIEGQEERARSLGADVVHVGIAGDEPLYWFFSRRRTTLSAKAAAATARRSLGQSRSRSALRLIQEV